MIKLRATFVLVLLVASILSTNGMLVAFSQRDLPLTDIEASVAVVDPQGLSQNKVNTEITPNLDGSAIFAITVSVSNLKGRKADIGIWKQTVEDTATYPFLLDIYECADRKILTSTSDSAVYKIWIEVDVDAKAKYPAFIKPAVSVKAFMINEQARWISFQLTANKPATATPTLPPLTLKIETDKTQYEAGERVLLSGTVQKLNAQGKYENYRAAPFKLQFEFPGVAKPMLHPAGDDRLMTDDQGGFSFAPYAPYKLGQYKITAMLMAKDYAGILTADLTYSVGFTVVAPTVDPTTVQQNFDKIIARFKSEIPPHAKEVEEEYRRVMLSTGNLPLALLSSPDPMQYGWWNNQLFGQNGFHCVGYTVKTIEFLNGLRFSREKIYRDLVRGIDYGPIARAYGASFLGSGEHHAVILYKYGTNWKNGTVLDPWPTQIPATYNIKQFEDKWGGTAVGNPDWTSPRMAEPAFPMLVTPSVPVPVYWNLDWAKGPSKYTEEYQWVKGVGITVNSPVALDISNEKGQRITLQADGKLGVQIENSEVYIAQNSSTDLHWYVWLPEGKYQVKAIGLADGTTHITTSQGKGVIQYYGAPVKKGEAATLKLDTAKLGEPLTLPDGKQVSAIPLDITKTTQPPVTTTTTKSVSTTTTTTIPTDTVELAIGGLIFLVIIGGGLFLAYRLIKRLTRGKKAISPQTVQAPSIPQGVKYCTNCGKQIAVDSVFCTNCGTKQS